MHQHMQNIMCNVLTNNIHEPGNIELGTHINIIHVLVRCGRYFLGHKETKERIMLQYCYRYSTYLLFCKL